MNVLDVFLLLQLFAIHVLTFELDLNVIQRFLQYKNVKLLNVYHCFNKKDEVDFVKNMSDYTTRAFNMDNRLVILKRDIFPKNNPKVGVIIDGNNCPIETTLAQFSELEAFTQMHPCLIFMRNKALIEPTFANLNLTISTDLKVITEDDAVYDIYNPSKLHGGDLVYNLYPHWNPETRTFQRTNLDNLYWTRKNMSGLVFRAMVILPKPFVGPLDDYMVNDENREIDSYHRCHAVLMQHVMDHYHYRLNYSMTQSWGFKLPNGSFDGLVGALESHKVDFGASPLFVKAERVPVVEYGRNTWPFKSVFLFRTPKRPASFQVFVRPLDGPVWYLTILACITIVLLLKVSFRAEMHRIEESEFESSWSHITLFTIGAMCQQGCATSPSGISSRIVFIFIFIFTVLLYQYYSASIISILVMSPPRFIKTLKDLAYSSLTLGSDDVLYHRDYIKKMANDSIINQVIRKNPQNDYSGFYVLDEIGLARVAAGGFAYHIELAAAYEIMSKTFHEDALCSLNEIPLYVVQDANTCLQKGSPFREMLDYVLQKIAEYGLLYRQRKHWHAKKPECIRSGPETASVSIEDFYPALAMLFLGMIMSMFIFVLELIIHIYQAKKHEEVMMQQLQIYRKLGVVRRPVQHQFYKG